MSGIQCMGKGRLVVDARGPEILQLFSPPYSSTSFITASIEDASEDTRAIASRSHREPGTAVKRHDILYGGTIFGRRLVVDPAVKTLENGAVRRA
jgi:hypothetical protein